MGNLEQPTGAGGVVIKTCNAARDLGGDRDPAVSVLPPLLEDKVKRRTISSESPE